MPTLRESGIDVEAYLWFGLFATSRTPASAINTLNAEAARFLIEPKTSQWIVNSLGGEFSPHTPAQFGEFLASDVATWQKVIKRAGVQLE